MKAAAIMKEATALQNKSYEMVKQLQKKIVIEKGAGQVPEKYLELQIRVTTTGEAILHISGETYFQVTKERMQQLKEAIAWVEKMVLTE